MEGKAIPAKNLENWVREERQAKRNASTDSLTEMSNSLIKEIEELPVEHVTKLRAVPKGYRLE